MLLKKGADLTLVDKDFKTALHWAVQVSTCLKLEWYKVLTSLSMSDKKMKLSKAQPLH